VERVPVTAEGVPPPGGAYSHGLQVGDFVFLAGQVGRDLATGEVGETIEEQTEATLATIEKLLAAAGCSRSDVVSCLVHLSDISLFARYNAVYERFFPEPRPVRTTVGAQLVGGLLVEITAVACRPG
jgi:2-iminobutanoate/2-iminopropanoate deaminase